MKRSRISRMVPQVAQMMLVLWAVAVMLLAGPRATREALALTEADCRTCHSGGTDDDMAVEHHTAAYLHNVGCGSCHPTIPGSYTVQVIRDCTVCHGQLDHQAAHNMVSTAADCLQCHTQTPVSEHLNRTSTCATCHSSTRSEVQKAITDGRAGIMVNCSNCHSGVNHIAQHDKAFPSADCVQCHAQGVLNEHLNRTSTCATCHSSAKPEVIQAIAAGRAGTAVNCSNCHVKVDHIAQHDKAQTATDCAQCHTKTVVDEHLSRGATCVTCHQSARPEVQQAITLGRAGTVVTCTNCHGPHDVVLAHDKATTAVDCAQCHSKGVVNEHLTRTSTCATCHSSTNATVKQTIALGEAGTTVNCNSCHIPHDPLTTHDKAQTAADCAQCHTLGVVNEHLSRGSTCATCHSSANATVLSTISLGRSGTAVTCKNCHITNHPLEHNMVSTAAGCAQCHTRGVLDEHLTRTSTCATCHSSSSSAVQQAIAAGRTGTMVDCVSCHGAYNHPTAHSRISFPYQECGSCHAQNVIIVHAADAGKCSMCHANSNSAVLGVIAKGSSGQTVTCTECHNPLGFGNHAGQHDKISLIDQTGFVTAHEQASIYCTACHTGASAMVAKVINDGMAGIQQSCNSCHSVGGNQPPTASAGPDKTVGVNQAVSFTGTGTDPDGTIAGYAWNFGDGTTASGATVTKTYTTAGTYTASLTVTDNAGATATDTVVVTVQAQATGAVFADQVLHMQRLSSVTSSDRNSTDLTANFRDSNLTDRYMLQSSSNNSYVVAMKLNRDALTVTKVVLRVYVSSISSSRTIRVYPYKSDGTSVNTSYSASLSTSSTGWKDIDVTSIAQRMNGFGWMKFRVAPTSSSLYVAEGAFQVQ